MPLLLKERDANLTERMEDPECDREKLYNTYRQFQIINKLISGWKRIYSREIEPVLEQADRTIRILDIGCGGGDIPLSIAHWASGKDHRIEITAIDHDQRALEYIAEHDIEESRVDFAKAELDNFYQAGRKFDIIISNHLIHHLNRDGLYSLLEKSRKLSRKKVIFNDIERNDLGYLLFNLVVSPWFRNSYARTDGLTSIKRSYTLREMKSIAGPGWDIQRLVPFRLLLTYSHE